MKKVLITSAFLVVAGVTLSACSLPTSKMTEQTEKVTEQQPVATTEMVQSTMPESSPVMKATTATDVTSLETELKGMKLEEESFR